VGERDGGENDKNGKRYGGEMIKMGNMGTLMTPIVCMRVLVFIVHGSGVIFLSFVEK